MTNQPARGQRYAQTAGILCADAGFRLWLDHRARAKFGADVPDGTHTEQDARDWLCRACRVGSRRDIDGNPGAVRTLVGIRSRFERWRREQMSGAA